MKGEAHWINELPALRSLGTPWKPAENFDKVTALKMIDSSELGVWIDRLRQAGVSANRHNSPDLLGQLTQAVRRPIDTVLCGILDSDAGACLNSMLAAKFPLELAAGTLLVSELVRAKRVMCVTDARVPSSWLNRLYRACEKTGITFEPILNDYPHAEPTLLVWGMTGRRLRPGRLPIERGVLVLDAAAAVAIGQCALLDEPMTQAPLAVRDRVRHAAYFVTAPVGITIAELFQQLSLEMEDSVLRVGDLLRDMRVKSSLMLGEGELVVHCTPPQPPVNPSPCTRCGWCVDWCATRVNPASILEAAQTDDLELAEKSGLEACIECGVCSYVCPSQLPLLDGIRRMQALALANH